MSNEITVKLKCNINEISKILESKGFSIVGKYYLDDTYFIPNDLKLNEISVRKILSKAMLLRNIAEELPSEKTIYKLTYKQKGIDPRRRDNKSKQNRL